MDAREEPFVSIVTPFYNTADYLEECILSVLSQSYANFEYVLLDNASTDGSTQIAERYAGEDSRIRFIRADELVDQVPNYNRALSQISPDSRYCKMVQADDRIFPACIEAMVRIAEDNPSVGVVGSLTAYNDRLGHAALPVCDRGVFDGRDAIRRYLAADHGFVGSPTCVLFRADLVRARDPFFAEAFDPFEDIHACLDLLEQSDFGFAYQVLTFNRRQDSGIWNRIQTYGPLLTQRMMMLRAHGPCCWEAPEFERRRAETENRYYALLATGLLTRKPAEFWSFHRHCLEAVGLEIDRSKLFRGVLSVLKDSTFHPMKAIRHLAGRSS